MKTMTCSSGGPLVEKGSENNAEIFKWTQSKFKTLSMVSVLVVDLKFKGEYF